LDIFTHRIISLFFRAWEKYRFPVDYERSQKEKQRTDDFTRFLFDFVGLGTRGLRGRLDLPDESLLPYSGLISNRPHSAVALRSMLSDYFSVPVKIEQFFGQWIDLDEDYILQLGTSDFKLGMNTVLGTRIWDDQSKFRVRVGPMTFEKFKAFLPNGSAHQEAFSMIRFFVGLEFDFDLQLVLMAKQVPSCILTTRAKRRPQLGWTTWLKTKPFKQDDEQVVLAAR
jgi:type VI secretion system protein ImpH